MKIPIQTQDEIWKREDKRKEEDVANKMVPIHIFMNFEGKFTSFFFHLISSKCI